MTPRELKPTTVLECKVILNLRLPASQYGLLFLSLRSAKEKVTIMRTHANVVIGHKRPLIDLPEFGDESYAPGGPVVCKLIGVTRRQLALSLARLGGRLRDRIGDVKIVAACNAQLNPEPRAHRQQSERDAQHHGQKGRQRMRRETGNAVEHQRIIAARRERDSQSHQQAHRRRCAAISAAAASPAGNFRDGALREAFQ
jgi:hypothetical protein